MSREQFEAWGMSDPDLSETLKSEVYASIARMAWQAASKASEQQLAAVVAENAGMKAGALQEIEVINRGGQAYCVKDGMSVNPIYARGWNDYRDKSLSLETPATDAYLAEVRAQGVDAAIERLIQKFEGTGYIGAPVMVLEHLAASLRQGAAL